MKLACALAIFCLSSLSLSQDIDESDWVSTAPAEEPKELALDRGAGQPPLRIQRGETLTYVVELDLGIKVVTVGEAKFRSWVEGPADGEVGCVEATFRGDYAGYELNHRLYTRHLPTFFLYKHNELKTNNSRHSNPSSTIVKE